MEIVRAKVKTQPDEDASVIPVAVPDLNEVQVFALQLHAAGQAWKGEVFGWQAEYNPERSEPPPRSTRRSTDISPTWTSMRGPSVSPELQSWRLSTAVPSVWMAISRSPS